MASEKFPVVRKANVQCQVVSYFVPFLLFFKGRNCVIPGVKHGWESIVRDGFCNRIKIWCKSWSWPSPYPSIFGNIQGCSGLP